MAPLVVLVAATLAARLAGRLGLRALNDWPAAVRAGLAVMFLFTAAAHFAPGLRDDLIRMVPPQVPYPALVVTFTGICEVAGAIGLLLPRTRRLAAIALILFLLAVLPANIHAALAEVPLRGRPPTPLLPRIALQGLFIGLIWWSGLHAPRRSRAGDPSGERTDSTLPEPADADGR